MISSICISIFLLGAHRGNPGADLPATYIIGEEVNLERVIWGQRPWSQLIGFDFDGPYTLSNSEQTLQFRPVSSVGIKSILHNEDRRAMYENNGLGLIQADVGPLATKFSPRAETHGDVRLSSTHEFSLSDKIYVKARPEFAFRSIASGRRDYKFVPDEAYLKLILDPFVITAGQQRLLLGQSDHGGLFFKDSDPSLLGFRIATRVVDLPWILRHLGPTQTTFFVYNWGEHGIYTNSIIYGLKFSMKPHETFELGFSHVLTLGMREGVNIKWYDPFLEFIFIRKSGLQGHDFSQDIANHFFGMDFRWSPHLWSSPTIYFEGVLEDLGKETFYAHFTDYMTFQFGVQQKWFAHAKQIGLLQEFVLTPPVSFRHGLFYGYDKKRTLLGGAYEPDSYQYRLEISLLSKQDWRAAFENQLFISHKGFYNFNLSSNQQPDTVNEVQSLGNEVRNVSSVSFDKWITDHFSIQSRVGYEHVFNYDFANGDKNFYLVSLGLNYRFTYSQ